MAKPVYKASGEYLHLAGRTGRMGATGTSITLVTERRGECDLRDEALSGLRALHFFADSHARERLMVQAQAAANTVTVPTTLPEKLAALPLPSRKASDPTTACKEEAELENAAWLNTRLLPPSDPAKLVFSLSCLERGLFRSHGLERRCLSSAGRSEHPSTCGMLSEASVSVRASRGC